ncbi:cell wall metabolism sensor histidine kinase WalK [Ferviditalea candida]|uniref:histidine kinase n=1 Tax=Ferviditalea candida TaxID=3108399 RepID=A0ABU5ZL23_9BACL|nr:cell wall metabolism sensor histidine kinase WalK [Paenibacillaceae bacterium T2]
MKESRFFQSIQIRLIIIYVLLILIAMQLIGVYFVKTLENTFQKTFSQSLNNQVDLLTKFVEPYLELNQEGKSEGKIQEELDGVVKNLNTISKAEIQIIDSNGIMMSTTSIKNRSLVGQKTTQTEVSRALQGIKVDAGTMVDSTGARYRVIAMPIGGGGKVLGAVYMIASMEDLYDRIKDINRILVSGTLIALGLTVLLGVILAHTITNPIKDITKQAKAIAEGDFNRQVNVVSHDEIGQLSLAFNHMTNRLKEALSQNEEEKEKLSSILSNMSDGVIATDDKGKIIVVNARSKQILRKQEQDMIGLDIAEVLEMSMGQIGKYVLGDENNVLIQLMDDHQEVSKQIQVTFTPIHRRGKGITGTIAVLHDVTEQEKMERSRREFVANVSHELRTPLTTIKSYLEALDDGAIEDPTLSRKFVAVARNETERMIRLVTDLLHLSRFDSQQAVLSKEQTNIVDMLEEVADRFSFQLQKKSIDILILTEGEIPSLMLDRDQIDQVLDNLVSNAIKYTPEGGKIEIRTEMPDKEHLLVSISDTGIGIPKKDLERIFDRFYRVDKARSRNMGGTGLGLSIAREIIKAHNGVIDIASEVNRGTTISFILPVQREGSEGK